MYGYKYFDIMINWYVDKFQFKSRSDLLRRIYFFKCIILYRNAPEKCTINAGNKIGAY